MTLSEWNALPHWKKCVLLHELGMSWKEISSACQISVAFLKICIDNEIEFHARLAVLDHFPLPRDPSEYVPRSEWLPYANCRLADPNWFVPKVGQPIDPRARACCSECTVTQECLDEVISIIDDFTYRAFTTPRIRRGYRKLFGVKAVSLVVDIVDETEETETSVDICRDDR